MTKKQAKQLSIERKVRTVWNDEQKNGISPSLK